MKISYNWLHTFIKLREPPEKLAEILTASGLEVESCGLPTALQEAGLLLGTIQSTHPCKERVATHTACVSIGTKKHIRVKCNTSTPAVGKQVVVALADTCLRSYCGKKIQVLGEGTGAEQTHGIMCTPSDLGISAETATPLYVSSAWADGSAAADALASSADCIFEIALTPNRGDAASHYGVARELAALLGKRLQLPKIHALPAASPSVARTRIQVKDPQACPRYSFLRLSNIQVKPSPPWLQQRLLAIDLSPVNNVVDITNYVMHALGQPLHAFDAADVVGDTMCVQPADKALSLQALNGKKVSVQAGDILVCDAEGPIALAGIIGSKKTAISAKTTAIILESAYFSQASIAKTSRRLGLQTDAAFRYARGTDPEQVPTALHWATQLLQAYAHAVPEAATYDHYPHPHTGTDIWCRLPRLNQLFGCTIPRQQLRRICKNLGLRILQEEKSRIQLRVPAYRSDVCREIDVFEEILRIYGYDKLEGPMQLNYSPTRHLSRIPQTATTSAANLLVDAGFLEIITSAIISFPATQKLPLYLPSGGTLAQIAEKTATPQMLRPSLLPSGMAVVAYNLSHKQENIRLFEFGRAYWRNTNGSYAEEARLALYSCGKRAEQPWLDTKNVDFYDLSSVIMRLFTRLGIHGLRTQATTHATFDMGLDWYLNKQLIATAGRISGTTFPAPLYAAELYWARLCTLIQTAKPLRYQPVSRSPQVRRDLSLVLDKATPYAQVQQLIEDLPANLLQQVQLSSVYEGDPLPDDKKSYALSFILQAPHTLSEKDIATHMQTLIKQFETKLGAIIRS